MGAEPDRIHGNLTMKAGGSLIPSVGTFAKYGLVVDKALTMTGGKSADTLSFFKLQVGGATNLNLGDGANVVMVDDSTFTGAFNLTTGKDVDQFKVETKSGTALPSVFRGAVLVKQGASGDFTFRTGTADTLQSIVFYRDFVIHHGLDSGNSDSSVPSKEYSPFGKQLLWTP